MASKSKKRSKKRPLSGGKRVFFNQSKDFSSSLQFYSFEITDEPINVPSFPDEVHDEMETLFEKSQKDPKTIIDRLEELIGKYPNIPQLYNFASVAYSNLNDKIKAKYYTEKNFENNPNYLFAKLNYAEICMSEGNHEKVPSILENKFDLKALYPERDVFHITEVVGFMGITATYFAHAGMNEQVKLLYEGLTKLAPNHPYTKRIERHLVKEKIKNQIKRLIPKAWW